MRPAGVRWNAEMDSIPDDLHHVYRWRQEQEAALRASKGSGMTDEEVVEFVNGCESSLGRDRIVESIN